LQLENFEEIIGILEEVEFQEKQGLVTLVFTFRKKIDLPISACDKDIPVRSIGKKIAIMRLDGDKKIRPVKNKKV